MGNYIPVEISAAAEIARAFEKSQVVIIAWDPVHLLTHTTSFGVSALDKAQAARLADFIGVQIGLDFSRKSREVDFRKEFEPALYRESLDLLKLIRNRNGCTPQMVQRAEAILNAAGEGVRAG